MVTNLPTWVHLPAPHPRGTCSNLLPKQVSVKGKEPKGEIRKPTRRLFILPRAGLLMMGGRRMSGSAEEASVSWQTGWH